jgi:hypothetical protein
MIMAELNPRPPEKLLEWAPTWKGEPGPRQYYVMITVWVPVSEAVDLYKVGRPGRLADYIHENLGYKVAVSRESAGGASPAGREPDDLTAVCIVVLLPRAVRDRLRAEYGLDD